MLMYLLTRLRRILKRSGPHRALMLAVWLLSLAQLGRAQVSPAAPAAADPDALSGQVRDQSSSQPVGFVSVSVLRHPYGTVADARGRFGLRLPASYDADSVRLSLVGYASRTLAVGRLRQLTRAGEPLLLRPQAVALGTARVRASGLRRVGAGNQGGGMYEGFKHNLSGNQLGQLITVKRPAFLQEVSFRITHCTYDTVYLRLNVYGLRDGFPAASVLPRPVYLRVSQAQTEERLYVNLRPYKLWLDTDVAVCVELVRSLGQGTLVFLAAWPGGGPSFQLEQTPGPLAAANLKPPGMTEVKVKQLRQPDNGPWTCYPNVGMGFDATLLELPE